MLVTFHTKSYANITMFGDIAVRLLKLMGHSGTVPSALAAEEVPAALERLKTAVAADKAKPPPEPRPRDDDERPPISLANRALPLIELLEAAAERRDGVMWD